METLATCPLCEGNLLAHIDDVAQLDRCDSCGYVFNNPRPTRSEIAAFYSRPAKYDEWLANEAARTELWGRRLRKMSRHVHPGSLLDVGTGTGQFLSIARSHFRTVTGTEVSAEGCAVAAERYELDVLEGELIDLELPPSSFDNVSMFHVLEHVHDPRATLRASHRLLADGGRLFLAVPNDRRSVTSMIGLILRFRSFLRGGTKGSGSATVIGRTGLPRIALDAETAEIHLSHFTVAVLTRLLEAEDFEIVECSADPFFVAAGFTAWLHGRAYVIGDRLARRGIHIYPTLWVVATKVGAGKLQQRTG